MHGNAIPSLPPLWNNANSSGQCYIAHKAETSPYKFAGRQLNVITYLRESVTQTLGKHETNYQRGDRLWRVARTHARELRLHGI